MEVLFFMKNGSARGVNYPKIRGARGVLFMDNTPRDMDNIGKNAGILLFILQYQVYLLQLFQIVLAYIDNLYVYDVML